MHFRITVLTVSLLLAWTTASLPSARASTASKSSVQVSVVTTDLTVGINRFAFGIIVNNHPLSAGRPHLDFYLLIKGKASHAGSGTAHFSNFARGLKDTDANSAAIAIKGVYVDYPTFKKAGTYGAIIRLRYAGRDLILHPAFTVRAHSLSPAVGSPAPRSRNPTVKQMPATRLDSGRPPDDMHKLSIAQGIAEHRPLVVVFATPAFCISRMCGPEVEVVQSFEHKYQRLGVNFIHIEVFKNANPHDGYAPTFKQWHLQTEPWVFVINRKGSVAAKFEGPTPAAEIEPAIRSAMH